MTRSRSRSPRKDNTASKVAVKPGAGPAAGSNQKAPIVPGPPADGRRGTAIQMLMKRGLIEPIARCIEYGLYLHATPQEGTMNDKQYKEYQYNFRRILQHYRRNNVLQTMLNEGTPQKLQFAHSMAGMDDSKLMSEKQRDLQVQYKAEAFKDALGVDVKDDAMWTATDTYACPKCGSEDCRYLNTISSSRKEDQSEDPTVTVRCMTCFHLWKAQGDGFSG